MGFARPRRGVGEDARNKVGHRRGITKSERSPVFGGLFAFWGSGYEVVLHGATCDKNVWNILHCAGFAQTRRAESRTSGVKLVIAGVLIESTQRLLRTFFWCCDLASNSDDKDNVG